MIVPRLLTILCLLGVCTAQPAYAQALAERLSKPMPEYELMPQADFEAATTLHEEVPYGDAQLEYSLRLPQDWQKFKDAGLSNYSFSNRLLGEVARYYGPPKLESPRSYFSIEALELDYQTSAEQWFLQYVLSNGFTLEGLKVHSEKKIEAIYVMLDKDQSYAVRLISQINGKRVVMARYFLPLEYWDQERSMQAQVVDSFKLKNMEDVLIEDMESYQFLDIAEFSYPVSWKLHAAQLRSIDRMTASLISSRQQNVLDGQIDINLISSYGVTSLKEEVDKFKAEQEEKGLIVGKRIERREGYDFDKMVDFAVVEAYETSDRDSTLVRYELWFTVMSSGGYYYFVTLLTPSREDDFFVWGRNMETYKIVLESITPQEDSLSEE